MTHLYLSIHLFFHSTIILLLSHPSPHLPLCFEADNRSAHSRLLWCTVVTAFDHWVLPSRSHFNEKLVAAAAGHVVSTQPPAVGPSRVPQLQTASPSQIQALSCRSSEQMADKFRVQRLGSLNVTSENLSVVSDFLWPHGLYKSMEFSRPDYWSG